MAPSSNDKIIWKTVIRKVRRVICKECNKLSNERKKENHCMLHVCETKIEVGM